jgi:hypothetical protein
MSNLKGELRHYGFSKAESNRPDWLQVANRLNIRPNGFGSINNSTNKNSLVWKNFATAVKHNLRNKYKNDTTIVDVRYKFNYVAKLKSGERKTRTYRGTYTTARERVSRDLRTEVQSIVEQLRESDVEIDDDVAIEIIGEEEVPVELGGNGIRKVLGIKYAKMRYAKAYKLNDDDDSWDLKEGNCIYDLLYYLYAPSMKRLMPSREVAYQNLEEFFNVKREEGVSIVELARFCDKYDITMIALDKEENLIVYEKKENRNRQALIFMIANNHIYPIFNKTKRESIVKKKQGEKTSSNSIIVEKEKVDYKHSVIPRRMIDYYYEGKPVLDLSGIAKVEERDDNLIMRTIRERGMPSRVSMTENNNIDRLVYGDEVLHIYPPTKEVLEVLPEWKGETYVDIAIREWADYDKDKLKKSLLSPQIQEVFDLDNIKNRAHYGATIPDTSMYEGYSKEQDAVVLKLKYITYEEGEMDKFLVDEYDEYGYKKPKGKPVMNEVSMVIREKETLWVKKQKDGEILCLDINKAYPYALSNPLNDFLIYSEEDCWENFDGVLKNGLYAIQTEDLTLFRLSNVYTADMLRLADENGIQYTILKQLIPKKPVPCDRNMFKDFFELMNEKFEGKKIVKLINNTITGIIGKTSSKTKVTKLDQDPEEVWRYLCDKQHKDLFLKNFHTRIDNEDEKLFVYGYETKTKMNEHSLPIYIQILDWVNIQLYNLTKLVGGKLLFRHTDCIVVEGGSIPRRITNAWGDYKLELKEPRITSKARTDNFVKFNFRDDTWKTYDYTDSDEYEGVMNVAEEEGGMLIEGRAGNGKSYIVKKYLGVWEGDEFVRMNDDVIAMSFTNKASNAIKGTTIHKTLKISKNNTITKKALEKFKFVKYVVIDEIGMVPSYLWRLIMLIKKEHPSLIFVLMGDFRQLPPVGEDLDTFNHPIVKYLCNNNRVELKVIHRYDKVLYDFLERGYEKKNWRGLKRAEVDCEMIYTSKNICYTNDVRRRINEMCMNYYKNEDATFIPVPEKQEGQDVWMYPGLPVMSITNNSKLGIVNGDEFIVSSYDDEKIYIDDFEVEINMFHKLFAPNYCATTHKSQGETYKCKVLLWEWNKLISNERLAYTACSRATDINNLIVVLNVI